MPQPLRHASTPAFLIRAATAVLAALTLAACGQSPSTPSADTAKLLTVPAPSGTTRGELQKRYPGAQVQALYAGRAGFAVLRLSTGTSALQAQALGAVEDAGHRVNSLQPGLSAAPGPHLSAQGGTPIWMDGGTPIWMDGGAVIWMDGGTPIWMDGGTPIWMDGNGNQVAQGSNGAAWDAMGLREAQAARGGAAAGAGRTVAVIDGGLDLTHPLLQRRLTDPSTWRDLVDGDSTPAEGTPGAAGYGHGTAVAGLVAQVAPGAALLPIRVLDSEGQGTTDQLAEAIALAVDEGANVINLSLGVQDASPAIDAAIRYAVSRGVEVVTAAGNTGAGTMDFPAALAPDLHGEVSVGASVNGQWSQPQVWSSGGMQAELLAPGKDLVTAAPAGGAARWTGTSMATAVASGALALKPDLAGDRATGQAGTARFTDLR
ncbi:S8 family serine peptidase [Deinococcus apachensis]|uniref:S8 family serine peptidase n=1 Tax=Deinococcus apachensis TaxID=309886 RepID=UPI000381EF9A|nr:S8 family serine peptidase [Deinococcus apachensis]